MLDIGCGHSPRGNVNLDLYPNATEHRSIDQKQSKDDNLDTKNIKNFIIGDACHLPFKDQAFKQVYSSHTIEHIAQPFKMFREMVRVSNSEITIVSPTVYGERLGEGDKPLHITLLNKLWYQKASIRLNLVIDSCIYSRFMCFPHLCLPWIRFPIEITFRGIKRK